MSARENTIPESETYEYLPIGNIELTLQFRDNFSNLD